MKDPDYMKYVVESQTVEDINGIRCYHCYQQLGDRHDKGCMAPAGTAIDELGDAIHKELIKIVDRGTQLANWIKNILSKYDKI